MEDLSAICCLLILLFGSSIHVTSTAEIGCEYDEIRFMRNDMDFLVDNKTENRMVHLNLTFNITRVIFGIVNFTKAFQSVVFNPNSNTEKLFKDKEDLHIFNESILTDSLMIEWEKPSDSCFTHSINMILLGCDWDEYYDFENDSSSSIAIKAITTTHAITATSTTLPRQTTSIPSTTILCVMETTINQTQTNTAAPLSESCEGVIYAAVIPVVAMLLLNIIAFGTLVLVLLKNKGKKNNNRLKRGNDTLREVPNESLYEMSSTEDKKDKEEDLYTPVFESQIRLGLESDYIEPRPLRRVAKRRPGSLPINSFAGRQYSEVTPYYSTSSLPRLKSNTINEHEEEGENNQLYQMVDSSSPVKGMERETGQSIVDSN